MYLLTAVINNEELLDELITGWLDIGISGSTVIDSTDSLQLISHHVPIFAGFRVLTGGGMSRSKTLFTIIEDPKTLHQAVKFLKKLCKDTGKSHQGIYFVSSLDDTGRLGLEVDEDQHKKHVEKKIGKKLD